MIRRKRSLMMVLCCGATLTSAGTVSAVNFVEYNFDDNDGIADVVDAGVIAGAFTPNGFSDSGFDGSINSRDEAGEATHRTNSAPEFWSFTLDSAQVMDLSAMEFDYQTERRSSSRDATIRVSVVNSINVETFVPFDFFSPSNSLDGDDVLSFDVGQGTGNLEFEDQDGHIVADLSGHSDIKFELRIYADQIASQTHEGSIDDVIVNGEFSDPDDNPNLPNFLAIYNFDNLSSSSIDTDDLTVAGDIMKGAGLGAASGPSNNDGEPAPAFLIAGNETGTGGNDTQTQIDFAVDNDDYMSFTLTPEDGSKMDLASLLLDHISKKNDDSDAGGSGQDRLMGIAVRSSIDGFASDLVVNSLVDDGRQFDSLVVDLTGMPAYQGLTEAVEFRIYGFENNMFGNLIDNLKIGGTSMRLPDETPAVPEPMTALLGVLGLGGLAMRRRR